MGYVFSGQTFLLLKKKAKHTGILNLRLIKKYLNNVGKK
jgi:hypothetical protein